MKVEVYKVVGGEKVKEILKKYGLTDEDRKVIDEIMEWWDHLVGKMDEKMAVAAKLLENNPRAGKIIEALLEINLIFAQKRLKGRAT